MSLALFGDLSAVSPDKLLQQSQKQLDKLQQKNSGTIADKAKIAALQAQIQVLNGGGSTADAKNAYKDTLAKVKDAAKPPIIPPLPDIPSAPETNYRPWVIGGVAIIGSLVALTLITSLIGGRNKSGEKPK